MDDFVNLELLKAVIKGNSNKVESLLAKGLTFEDANVWGKKAMKFAIKHNHTDIMKLLYEKGFYTTESGLYSSIFFNDIETLKSLLNNDKSASFQNAFLIAVDLGKIEIINIFLNEFNISFYSKNDEGKTASDIANEKGNQEVVQFLSKYEYNNNQLIRACKCLKTDQVKRFLNKGANVNFMDADGESVLALANKAFCKDKNALATRKEIANLLHECGAKEKANPKT